MTYLRSPNAKLLFVYGPDAVTDGERIAELQRVMGIKVDIIDPHYPQFFFIIHPDDLESYPPKQVADYYRQLIKQYERVVVFLSPQLTANPMTSRLITQALLAQKVIAVGIGHTIDHVWRLLPDNTYAEVYPFEIYRHGTIQTKPWSLLMAELDRWGQNHRPILVCQDTLFGPPLHNDD